MALLAPCTCPAQAPCKRGSAHQSGDQTKLGSDSAIVGHFSETAILYNLWAKNGRVSTPVTPFFRSTHGSGDQTKFGSDSAIGGHFSETAILYDLWAKNGRVSTPVISLGYPLAGERFGSVFFALVSVFSPIRRWDSVSNSHRYKGIGFQCISFETISDIYKTWHRGVQVSSTKGIPFL